MFREESSPASARSVRSSTGAVVDRGAGRGRGGPGLWPSSAAELETLQRELAVAADAVGLWAPAEEPLVAGVFIAYPSGRSGPGEADEPCWAAAVLARGGRELGRAVVRGRTRAPYVAGLLALRCGPLLERAVDALPERPDLVLVDATGRDHPRRAGMALHLGAALDVPTVGVTNRALAAVFPAPAAARGAWAPLILGHEVVGFAVRRRPGAHPVLAHSAWRTSAETAREVVRASTGGARTPEPLRSARTLARVTRAVDEGRFPGSSV